jgi:hypothetical protein
MRGRPRGSGRTRGIPAIPLTAAETVFYRAGQRIAAQWDNFAMSGAPTIDAISPYLTPRERRAVLTVTDDFVITWVMIGAMQYHLEVSVIIARRS